MQELEITIGRLLRIFWLISWRGILGAAAIGFVVGFVVAFVLAMASVDRATISSINVVLGFTAGLIWYVVVLRMALKKRYDDFRIALLPLDSAAR